LFPAIRARSAAAELPPSNLPLPFLRTKEAALFIGVSCRTLEKHRIYGTGPNYSKISSRVFYAIGDLTEWAKRGATTLLPPAP
jgi:hypothetical protein